MRKGISIIAALTVCGIAYSQTFSDDFNRANSGNLGANWTTVSASATILNNQATNGQQTLGLATVNGFSAAYTNVVLSVDAISGTSGTSYIALVFGYGSTGSGGSIFIKVQDNDGNGDFDHLGFYTGNNNSGGGLSGFGTLNTPFSGARLTVWASSATTVNLGVDSDFNGSFEQTYSSTGANTIGGLGTGIGLGLYGTATADNYFAAVPEPATLFAFGLAALALRRRRK